MVHPLNYRRKHPSPDLAQGIEGLTEKRRTPSQTAPKRGATEDMDKQVSAIRGRQLTKPKTYPAGTPGAKRLPKKGTPAPPISNPVFSRSDLVENIVQATAEYKDAKVREQLALDAYNASIQASRAAKGRRDKAVDALDSHIQGAAGIRQDGMDGIGFSLNSR